MKIISSILFVLLFIGIGMANSAINLLPVKSIPPMSIQQNIESNAPGIMIYNSKGIAFEFGNKGQRIANALINKPTSPLANKYDTVNDAQVIPGYGAFGIKLDDSKETVRQNKFPDYPKSKFDNLSSLSRKLDNGRKIWLAFSDNKVKYITAYGPFTTPDGITDKSSVDKVLQIYGKPDTYLKIETNLVKNITPLLIYIILGVLCGILLNLTQYNQLEKKRIIFTLAIGLLFGVISSLLSIVFTASQVSAITILKVSIVSAISISLAISIYENIKTNYKKIILLPIIISISVLIGVVFAFIFYNAKDYIFFPVIIFLNVVFVTSVLLVNRNRSQI